MAKSSGSGWRQKSNGFLASIAAVTLIVVLLGGMGIGYAIEKGRVKPAKTTAAQRRANALRLAAAKKAKTKKAAKVVRFRIVGTVSTISGGSITVAPKKGATRKLTVGKSTAIEKSGSGATSDISANHKILLLGTGKSLSPAKAVIVLPKTSRIGVLVSSADGSSMTITTGKKSTKVTTTGANVDKTSPGKSSDITKGETVMISGVKIGTGGSIAVEIIVLPSNSPFA